MLRQKVMGLTLSPEPEHDMTICRILQPGQEQLSYQARVNGDHASKLGHNVLILTCGTWRLASAARPE
jgi:hypothetical protein